MKSDSVVDSTASLLAKTCRACVRFTCLISLTGWDRCNVIVIFWCSMRPEHCHCSSNHFSGIFAVYALLR